MKKILPVMILKSLILLPNQEVKLELNNDLSRKIIMMSGNTYNKEVLIVCPKNELEEVPEVDDLPLVAVVGKIKSKIELPNDHLRVKLIGLKRVEIIHYFSEIEEELLKCEYNEITVLEKNEAEEIALKRKLISCLKKYIKSSPNISNSILTSIADVESLNTLTDMISTFIPINFEKKLRYMEEINPVLRAEYLIQDINLELEVIKLDYKIENSLRQELEQNQKEFILREKIREIEKELGEENLKEQEVLDYLEQVEQINCSAKTKQKITHEIKKYDMTPEMSPDSSIIRNYLDWILNLPWNEFTEEETDLNYIEKKLNESHYGLQKIKDRIIEYVAVKKKNKNIRTPILCLVGPPGVGKTSIALSIAKSLKKEFYKISVGGLNDSAELNGHRRTYIGASPGKIMQAMNSCGTKNPLILIDEVDKMVKDYKGDPASVLLDILDREQNTSFIDNYIEEPFDLSHVFFLLTANYFYHIPNELRDRLEIIEVSSYTMFEKMDIAKKYIIPNILKEHGLKDSEIKITDGVLESLINHYTKEAGVRELDRVITCVIRKIVTESFKENAKIKKTILKTELKKFLGEKKFENDVITKNMTPGLVYGLAYTPYGGAVLPMESCFYEGHGKINYTGSLGKVMEESIAVAMSYLKSNHQELKINDYYFKTKDIHIHALEGAIPKDGPSAGVTMVTSLISLIRGINIPSDVAMTGEITLRGEILPIGGLREKLIGAYNENIKRVFIPLKNHSDLSEIPDFLKQKIEIIEVSHYKEIFKVLFKD